MEDGALWSLGKAVGPLLRPSLIFSLLLFLGGVLAVWPLGDRAPLIRAGGHKLLIFVVAAGGLIAATNPGAILLTRLETAYPAPPALDEVPQDLDPAGIIVLGGAVDLALSDAIGHLQLNRAAERPLVFAALAHRFPDVPAIYSGGAGRPTDQGRLGEAQRMVRFLAQLGLVDDQVWVESTSRSTWENATHTASLLRSNGARPVAERGTWILVTSARHMSRAIGAFSAAGFAPITPWPTDFSRAPQAPGWAPSLNLPDALLRLDSASYEISGLLWYHLTNRMADPHLAPFD